MADDEAKVDMGFTATAPEVRRLRPDELKMMHQLVTVAQQVFAPWRTEMVERQAFPNSDTLLAAAMCTFAGCVLGELVGMGVTTSDQVAAMLDGMRENLEAGVTMGQKHVARVADAVLQEESRKQGTERKQ